MRPQSLAVATAIVLPEMPGRRRAVPGNRGSRACSTSNGLEYPVHISIYAGGPSLRSVIRHKDTVPASTREGVKAVIAAGQCVEVSIREPDKPPVVARWVSQPHIRRIGGGSTIDPGGPGGIRGAINPSCRPGHPIGHAIRRKGKAARRIAGRRHHRRGLQGGIDLLRPDVPTRRAGASRHQRPARLQAVCKTACPIERIGPVRRRQTPTGKPGQHGD